MLLASTVANLAGVDNLVGDSLDFVAVDIGCTHPDKCRSFVLEVLVGSSDSCTHLEKEIKIEKN